MLRRILYVIWRTSTVRFAAVSTPAIARVGALFSIFQDLQDNNTPAPLRSQNLSRKVVTILLFFQIKKKELFFNIFFSTFFVIFARKFHEHLAELKRSVLGSIDADFWNGNQILSTHFIAFFEFYRITFSYFALLETQVEKQLGHTARNSEALHFL